VDVVRTWTGREADALRHALRMTNEAFAAHLGVAVRTVAAWRKRPDIIPQPRMQETLDGALNSPPNGPRRNLACSWKTGKRQPLPASGRSSKRHDTR